MFCEKCAAQHSNSVTWADCVHRVTAKLRWGTVLAEDSSQQESLQQHQNVLALRGTQMHDGSDRLLSIVPCARAHDAFQSTGCCNSILGSLLFMWGSQHLGLLRFKSGGERTRDLYKVLILGDASGSFC